MGVNVIGGIYAICTYRVRTAYNPLHPYQHSGAYLENMRYFAECPLFSTTPSFMGILGIMDGRMVVCSIDWKPLFSGGSRSHI